MTTPAETSRPARVRPRFGRLAAFGSAVLVTFVTLLGGLGLLPSDSAAAAPPSPHGAISLTANIPSDSSTPQPAPMQSAGPPGHAGNAADAPSTTDVSVPLPANSGEGRRVVFDMSDQRVWLVGNNGKATRTYLVSGSMGHNLKPGTYSVYSRSMDALGIDGTTMHYMVRFAYGSHAPIGFHDIPLMHGKKVQTQSQLGIPKSHGCIRQWPNDAKAMWHFAPLGTKVVVTA